MYVFIRLSTGLSRTSDGQRVVPPPPDILNTLRKEAKTLELPEDTVIARVPYKNGHALNDVEYFADEEAATAGSDTSKNSETENSTAMAPVGKAATDKSNEVDISKLKVEIERTGDKMIIPPSMSLDTAIAVLRRQQETEERIVQSFTAIDSYPLDLAYALTRAVEKRYNFVATKNNVGMFGQEIPPPLVGLEVGIKDGVPQTVQVYWGKIPLPGFTKEEYVECGVSIKNDIWVGTINAHIKGKNKFAVDELIELTRQELAAYSVYKSRAVKAKFAAADPDTGFNPDEQPRFMDLEDVNGPQDLIFSSKVAEQLQTNVFNLVQRTELCVQFGLPRKRGILLEGPYGTGKTLTAKVLAKLCEQNGWTFLYLNNVSMLPQAIQFARIFGRTVVFAEDIDQVFNGKSRTEEVNAVLNTMDGVDTKNSEVMVVLTTNEIADIHRAMLRPGRIDAVINIAAPDAEATERMIRHYSKGMLVENTDISAAVNLLVGKNAASIRETVERAKGSALTTYKSGPLQLTGDHLRISAETMQYHLDLLKEPEKDVRTPMQVLGDAIGHGMNDLVKRAPANLTEHETFREFVTKIVTDENNKIQHTRSNGKHSTTVSG
jgi:transitional endoplasmic reticulum ATPase